MSLLAFHYFDKNRATREKVDGIYWFRHVYSDQKGATGLIGSVDDLARFMLAYLADGGEFQGRSILQQSSIDEMATPVIDADRKSSDGRERLRFGLGWFVSSVDGRISLSHGGAGAAFVDYMRVYPGESLGIAVMANSTYLGRNMGAELVEAIARLDWGS